MATLVFSAVGTALGGPLGGALGALVGNQLDHAIVGSPKREGPRLKDLAVTTSSYGTVIARHFGRLRASGTVIWATELQETKEKSGGSKGSPSLTAYAYTVSFAVALASRPIRDIGRIWADGSLLRGAAGDLKVGGQFRLYRGTGDQDPDPLIAADRGLDCPAFRNIAYCVFEDLQLANFGNRIPSLTFEVIADDGAITLSDVAEVLGPRVAGSRPLPELIGISDEGGPLAANLALIDQLYPIICDGRHDVLQLTPGDEIPASVVELPEPAVDTDDDAFGGRAGKLSRRRDDQREVPAGLRYYDFDRDYQAGLQRAERRAEPGRNQILEFPGVFSASKARQLCDALIQRAGWSSDQLLWRITEVDPTLAPGQVVSVPGRPGTWRIESWEWRTTGVELDLRRLPPGPPKSSITEAGVVLAPRDNPATPTILEAFELPWNGVGSADARLVFAAASSSGVGWTGAALYAEDSGSLNYLQPSGSRRSTVGTLIQALPASQTAILHRQSILEVQLASDTFSLASTDMQGLAAGENRVLVGKEVLQFASAVHLGAGIWQLTGLLRGRGGTESEAQLGHSAGAAFVLLDDRPVLLDFSDAALAATGSVAAIGLADDVPVIAAIGNAGLTRRPLTPVHSRVLRNSDGSWGLSWTRRARGAWNWPDTGEIPLNEQTEQYMVGVGNSDAPSLFWAVADPWLDLPSTIVLDLRANHIGEQLWVRQIGTSASSDPLLLCTID